MIARATPLRRVAVFFAVFIIVSGGLALRTLRNLTRRKLRTTLTVVGITIGIWALVVMSSMANKISALVEGGSNYFADKIIVSDATNSAFSFGAAPIPIATAREIEAIEGVDVAMPEIGLLLDPDASGAGFGLPDMITASTPGADKGREKFPIKAAQGRLLVPDDEGKNVAILGADLARKFKKKPGDTMKIREVDFEIVGVLEPTLTAPDTSVWMPLAAGQLLLAENLPLVVQRELRPSELASQIVVYPDAGADIAAVAKQIEEKVPSTQTLTGAEFDKQIGSSIAIFNAIILGVALISLIVGGLSVINTMAMSVAERTREIGVKRAIGATRVRIVREIVIEAAVIGLIGGVIGLVLGSIVVFVANGLGRASGTVLFQLTPGTAAFAVVFATVLGMAAGLIPAWNAARLDPVEALRYE
jgi:putative ABC transport system permease protein